MVLGAAAVAQVADDCIKGTAPVVVASGAVGEKAAEWWDVSPGVPDGGYTDLTVLMQLGTDVEDRDAPRDDVRDGGTMAAWGEPTVFERMQAPEQLGGEAGLGDGGDEASWLTALGYQTWLEEMQVAEAQAWELRYHTAEEIAGRTGYESDDDGGSSTGGSSSSGGGAECGAGLI